MPLKKVSEILVAHLAAANVTRIYGIAGDSLNGITEALRKYPAINWIHTRHEETAAFAAGAQATLTGELAVCAGSCGPGNLHLINGLYDCQRNKAPVLAIAAHIPSNEIGSGYFQETHPEILFRECSVFCEMLTNPEQMPRLLAIAMQTAIANKGVAVLVLSGDIALQKTVDSGVVPYLSYTNPIIQPNETELKIIAKLLNASHKTTLLCGAGCKGAHAAIMQLCDRLKAPIVHSLRAKEQLEFDNPYDVGMTGLIGFSSGYYAMAACDTLLILGSSFPYRQFYPSHAKIIQIDIDGSRLGLRCRLTKGVVGDVASSLKALLPHLKQKQQATHLQKSLNHYQKARKQLDELAVPGKSTIHPQYLYKVVSELAADDAVFTVDVGTPCIWAARYLSMNGKRKILGSFNHGSMANALSQAIGAQAINRQQQVVALCGDGGFTMLMGEIITLVQMNLPIKIILLNNGTLGFVEMEMKASGFINTQPTTLDNPNFAAMVQSMGFHGTRVEKSNEVESAIKAAFAHDGPSLVDVVTNRTELAMPPKITAEHIMGFSLYVGKAILNGKGDEIIELAKTNLWR